MQKKRENCIIWRYRYILEALIWLSMINWKGIRLIQFMVRINFMFWGVSELYFLNV